jgi:hypothetical protein
VKLQLPKAADRSSGTTAKSAMPSVHTEESVISWVEFLT